MISVDEAIRILKENMPALRLKKVVISEAHSVTLAREIRAPEPSPRYTNSAMDGFAVRWQDVKGANKESPVFLRVRQKPGEPFFAARKQDTLLLGLPGNPVSAFVYFTHYVRPMITALSGRPMERRTLTARSGEQIANHGKRTNFFRVRIANRNGGTPLIRGIEKQGSHMLSSIVHAHGYILLQEGEVLAQDSSVEVMLF